MRRLGSVEELPGVSGDFYLADRTWTYFSKNDLWGFQLRGDAEEDGLRRLIHVVDVELELPLRSHAALVDARDVRSMTPGCFTQVREYFAERRPLLGGRIERCALVKPASFFGVVLEGLSLVIPPPFPLSVFSEIAPALDALGLDDPTLVRQLDAMRAAEPPSDVLAELHALLDREIDLDIASAARSLATSARTLQRRLQEAGSSFQKELRDAQIRTAKRLLAHGDTRIAQIAQTVGCSSQAAFSTIFRSATGMTPLEWRRRHRE
jgi:AraC-like DNA-binding protein